MLRQFRVSSCCCSRRHWSYCRRHNLRSLRERSCRNPDSRTHSAKQRYCRVVHPSNPRLDRKHTCHWPNRRSRSRKHSRLDKLRRVPASSRYCSRRHSSCCRRRSLRSLRERSCRSPDSHTRSDPQPHCRVVHRNNPHFGRKRTCYSPDRRSCWRIDPKAYKQCRFRADTCCCIRLRSSYCHRHNLRSLRQRYCRSPELRTGSDSQPHCRVDPSGNPHFGRKRMCYSSSRRSRSRIDPQAYKQCRFHADTCCCIRLRSSYCHRHNLRSLRQRYCRSPEQRRRSDWLPCCRVVRSGNRYPDHTRTCYWSDRIGRSRKPHCHHMQTSAR